MSSQARVAEVVATPAPHRPMRRDEQYRRRPIDREDLGNLPTRKGRPGALQFFDEIGVAGITPTRVRTATENGTLRRFLIAGHTWYADRDLFDWLMTLASGGAK